MIHKAIGLFEGYTVDDEAGVVISPRGARLGHRCPGRYVFVQSPSPHRKLRRAHRVIWEAVHGQIPDGLEINHIDGDKHNNSLSNLELVTRSENLTHAIRTGLKKPVCGEAHSRARLTTSDVAEIRRRVRDGEAQNVVASAFGVGSGHVNRIVHGHVWKSTREAAA